MRADIEADQLEKLTALFLALQGRNAFYSTKLRGIESIPSFEWFSEHIPFTTKRELIEDQHIHPPYGSNLTYPLERYTRFSQTNGTTGTPLRWLDTQESWDWMAGNWKQVFQAADVGAGDRIFFAFSFGPFLGFWVAFEAASRMGCLAIPGGGMRSSARLHAILDNAVTVLCCTPTYALRLGESAVEEHIDISQSKVRRIIVAGEPGGSIKATQTRIQELWRGARVVDHHGMTEVGPVSYSCPKRDRVLHIIEASYFAEVIDPANSRPVEPGERGELVLTNLGRIGSPLIRYRTGDIVQRGASEQCECGSHDLALEGGILARTDDMVVVRGVNLYPSAIEEILRDCDGVAEYRVEIRTERSLSEMSIQVEPSHEESGLAHRLESALRDTLGLRIPVSTVPRGALPRFEMKAQRWVRI
ncbi:MAG TPA: AMP-binding protein [Bryobacteraceae bacterium]|nr:AMP-binding protein [Bryobacteraceae bacterium]